MSSEKTPFDGFKHTAITIAVTMSVIWLVIMYAFPNQWNAPDAFGMMFLAAIPNLVLVPVGIAAVIAASYDLVRARFGITLLLAVIVHATGIPFDSPWCNLFFLSPSVAIFVVSWNEWGHAPAPKSDSGA